MAIKIYNTLSRKIETFKPLEGNTVRMYACGPTVYWFQHIGNMRTYALEDSFRALLEHEGYKVLHARNYTDVGHLTSDADEGEDKIEKAARREGKSPKEIADFYIADFEETEKILGNVQPTFGCRATEYIKEMQELIKKIEEKGYAYTTSTGVFFDTSKFKNYGKLARLKTEGQKKGAREEVILDEEKKNAPDFALWFINKPEHIMQWDSPWGKGYPGWHIECSAMSMKCLGGQLDIHFGGKEHVPVHHTNEIAQSEAATGKQFTKYWMHFNWLVLEKGKMSKSSGEIVRVKDLVEKGFSGKQIRFFLLSGAHYRAEAVYSEKNLQKAAEQLKKINEFIGRVRDCKKRKDSGFDKVTKKARKEIFAQLKNDYNIPMALNALFSFMKKANAQIAKGKIGCNETEKIVDVLKEIDSVLKVMDFSQEKAQLADAVTALIEKREQLRKEKKFAEADAIRSELKEKGIELMDTPEGVKWKKKS